MSHDTRYIGGAGHPMRVVLGEAAGIAAAALDGPRRRAGATLDGIAHGVATAGRELRRHHHRLAGVADDASAWLHRLARDVRTRPIGELGGEVAAFAQRRPWLFAAGTFTAGVALALLIRERNAKTAARHPLPVTLAARRG